MKMVEGPKYDAVGGPLLVNLGPPLLRSAVGKTHDLPSDL